jgi:thioredoxin-related protein
MTQKNSKTQKYKSITTGKPCSAAQYIAELVCIRKSERKNKGSLGYKFWNNDESYQIQVRVAHKLIKKYDEQSILHYLNNDGKNVYSLGYLHSSKKFVLPIKFVQQGIEKSYKIVQEQNKKEKKTIELPTKEYKPRKQQSKNNLLNKLRKADGTD